MNEHREKRTYFGKESGGQGLTTGVHWLFSADPEITFDLYSRLRWIHILVAKKAAGRELARPLYLDGVRANVRKRRRKKQRERRRTEREKAWTNRDQKLESA